MLLREFVYAVTLDPKAQRATRAFYVALTCVALLSGIVRHDEILTIVAIPALLIVGLWALLAT